MISHRAGTRFAWLTCRALGGGALSGPAQAQEARNPSGAPPGPLLNGATPFTQTLLVDEELGPQALPKTDSQLEDFLGSYVEHCHNTTHEDYAMMLRFDVANPTTPMVLKAPLPSWSGVTCASSSAVSG